MSDPTKAELLDSMTAGLDVERADEPFACPHCGQMLAASCRVCVSCKQPVDSTLIRQPAPAATEISSKTAAPPRPVERASFSWQIFFLVFAAWLAAAIVAQQLLGPRHGQWLLGTIVVISSAWVYFDARERRVPKPMHWGLGALLFWILIFPWYLARRQKPEATCPFVEREPGPLTRALLLGLALFFLLSLVVMVFKGPPSG